jgi:hypothetical protein
VRSALEDRYRIGHSTDISQAKVTELPRPAASRRVHFHFPGEIVMHIANVLRFTGAVVAAALVVSIAHAQLFRAYLAPTGNDANDCTLPTPCRLLPAALAAVADGGEIWMLGSANYNTATVNIAKSVSILAVPGVVGSVVATAGPAINIATPGVKVSLRNLVIAPLPGAGGTDGIDMTNGASLTVDSCLIANLPGTGIYVVNTAANVYVVDSLIRENGNRGVWLQEGPTAHISGTKLLGNSSVGVAVYGYFTTTRAAISDSIISGNGAHGIYAYASTGSANVSVSRSTVSNNTYGILSDGNISAVVTISSNLVTKNNIYGLEQNGSAILESQGNNTVRQNGNNTVGTITTISGI